jgi:hypothetical protein
MQYIHVVNGDVAGTTLRQALAQAARPDPVVVLRDDLAVGPIADIDSTGLIRSGFWQRVAPHSDIDFAAEMRQALDQFQPCAATTWKWRSGTARARRTS